MKAIVTVKIAKRPDHDPTFKLTGVCPVTRDICTDITGQHHSFIAEGQDIPTLRHELEMKKWHVTRIEVLRE